MMKELSFPIAENFADGPTYFESIKIRWNEFDRVTRLEFEPFSSKQIFRYTMSVEPPVHSKDFPKRIVALKKDILNYFRRGEPITKISWEDLETSGFTSFQCDVYRTISEIPHGETRTYGWVAQRIGKIGANRAVGQCLKRNPIPLLIPCHRVTGIQDLGGFMGIADPNLPEIHLKQHLVELEANYRSPVFAFA